MIDSFKETINYVPWDMPWARCMTKILIVTILTNFSREKFYFFYFLALVKNYRIKYKKDKKDKKIIIKEISYQKEFLY